VFFSALYGRIAAGALICILTSASGKNLAAQPLTEPDSVPLSVRPFVERGTRALAISYGDLNGDGRSDVILVLEKLKAKESDDAIEINQRPLLVLLRNANGSLSVAARNEKVVYCSTCGGVFGDPFNELVIKPRRFTVSHYGGSNWRWTADYTFSWSPRDRTWQLVRVEESSYHTSAPDQEKRTVSTPPKRFGKINLADFDPEHWKGVGKR